MTRNYQLQPMHLSDGWQILGESKLIAYSLQVAYQVVVLEYNNNKYIRIYKRKRTTQNRNIFSRQLAKSIPHNLAQQITARILFAYKNY